MPIAFRYNADSEGITKRGGEFIIVCDHCGEEIDLDGDHNVEAEQAGPHDVRKLLFFHYDCGWRVPSADPDRKRNYSKLLGFDIRVNETNA